MPTRCRSLTAASRPSLAHFALAMAAFLSLGACDSPAPADAGPSDAGPSTLTDAGPDERDAGPTCGVTRPPSLQDQCSAETQNCWSSCQTNECVATCIGGDANPGCAECFGRNQVVCVAEADCAPQWRDLDCCREAECPDQNLTNPGCLNDACASEYNALLQCGSVMLGQGGCAGSVSQCF